MSRRTYDTESLTIRKVFALYPNNSNIPAQRVLTADGQGGTYWAIPSTLGALPSWNQFDIAGTSFIADASSNTMTITPLSGVGFTTNSSTNTWGIFSKGFSQFDISGGNSLYGYSGNLATPTVKFIAGEGIHLSANPLFNTLTIRGGNPVISTGVYAYNEINVYSNASTLNYDVLNTTSNRATLTTTSPSTTLNVIGVGDILLDTQITSNAIFFSISTFTSKGYQDLSGAAYGAYSSVLSTVSSTYYTSSQIDSLLNSNTGAISTLSTNIGNSINYWEDYMNNLTTLGQFYFFSTNIGNVINSNMCFESTLLVPEANTSNVEGVLTGSVLEVSSASFRLDSMSSLIQTGANVYVNFSPSLLFNSTMSTSFFTVSSCIFADGQLLPSTTFTRPWIPTNTSSPNLYTDTMTLQIPNLYAKNYIASNFYLKHEISPVTTDNNLKSTFTILTSPNNSLLVRVSQKTT